MPRGSVPGERRGGRQKGVANKRTRDIADRAAAEGITPLEVMLKAMRQHADAERWDEAAAIAKDAAPYLHPRLASVQMAGTMESVRYEVSSEPMTTDEWEARHCEGGIDGEERQHEVQASSGCKWPFFTGEFRGRRTASRLP